VNFLVLRSTSVDKQKQIRPSGGHVNSSSAIKVTVALQIEISAAAIEAVAQYARARRFDGAAGAVRLDAADMLGLMVSRFLALHDFEGYTRDAANYEEPMA
jgi:hypothetical protein